MAILGEHESLQLTLGGAGCLTIDTRSTFGVELNTLGIMLQMSSVAPRLLTRHFQPTESRFVINFDQKYVGGQW